jgi:hypothetical protein
VLNLAKSEIHSKNMTQTFVVKFGLNIGYGKQVKHSNKLINNTDNELGIISGVKQ